MALSKSQQHVVDRMKEGWALGLDNGLEPWAWLQQNGLGRGGATEKVKLNTFSGLERRKVICRADRDSWSNPSEYLLVPQRRSHDN